MKSAPTTIINKLGLHARAATRLVNRATAFKSDINLVRGQRSVNAKSIMGVLTLAASMGTELVILADGPDEEEAVAALLKLINDRFGEEQ
ncbi:MAG: HPr family phosphocarrier protein [Xanthomonadales bacterium]|nr:HPr family phosphocarrier protein [Gammaproteobacteria bacterium]MBT8050527.1 HPr family phosphocarrier protein [Gammaproteobacteria bacterium]MBT8056084.1 HPr family phosphocarrier protein [Gammaproteobacteria bacterium]NNJ78002.1 HPr family phosphocarrier protein [Xanthomonadales bacterium]NNL04380.1 HPr family phosphocarrier protein [Xanthomonadales bacterium]